MKEQLRQIPPIHELQHTDRFERFTADQNLSFEKGTELVKESVSLIRKSIRENNWDGPQPGTVRFLEAIYTHAELLNKKKFSLSLHKVINASGTVLHTNLGRARLGPETIEHMSNVAGSYTNLEYEVEKGNRGSRHTHAEKFICELTGAEAAMVVNNNAAAVFLILSALAKNKEVIVSRGELVEIGGSFRVSSIMEESGAKLMEVGTTNKTHLHDFESHIGEDTAMIMKVHQSNFIIKGFTSSVESGDLVHLTRKYDHVVYYEDLGSGALYDFTKHGIGTEPLVRHVIEKGADLVSFSGDKLLGGPQAGIIAGRKDVVNLLKKHQLARVLRVDKMTLAALEMTLLHYLKKEEHKIPAVNGIIRQKEEIMQQSMELMAQLKQRDVSYNVELVEGKSKVGGGTMPEVELDTYLISIRHSQFSSHELHERLRMHEPSIIARIQQERLLIDLRTVSTGEQVEILQALDIISNGIKTDDQN
ncbi:L-seryl-tRNA(Sec) selenium transferase [Rossellomorea sp. NS-SX7]|uniref:L-seryl-tRNA(Sec) selenium transferase n=1 Tax=Rossellomorea sp. NS-SX7 TaxID=3463856 RepID=UPI00405A271E